MPIPEGPGRITLLERLACLSAESITLSVESITLPVESTIWFAHRCSELDESIFLFSEPVAEYADVDTLLVQVDTLLDRVVTLRAKGDDDRDHRVTGFDESMSLRDR